MAYDFARDLHSATDDTNNLQNAKQNINAKNEVLITSD